MGSRRNVNIATIFVIGKFRGARKVFWPHTGGRKPLECNRHCEQKKLQHPAITVYSEFIVS